MAYIAVQLTVRVSVKFLSFLFMLLRLVTLSSPADVPCRSQGKPFAISWYVYCI